MSAQEFIIWLKGFLVSRSTLSPQDTEALKSALSQVRFVSESKGNSSKQILHD